ncbi:MAG: hypothetical protein JJU27_04390 [Gammaproteobacteria bacterium]|nr:hypothetical protein [Gammaproteobacteria bacterium]
MLLALAAALALTGCGRDTLVGTYEDELGMTRYEFLGQGQVHVSVLGTTVVAEYRLDDDRVLVTGPQGTLVLTRHEDRLHGPMGLVLRRSSGTPGNGQPTAEHRQ